MREAVILYTQSEVAQTRKKTKTMPWKKVADYIYHRGGFRFGPLLVKEMWQEYVRSCNLGSGIR